jgi:hypothetical protein
MSDDFDDRLKAATQRIQEAMDSVADNRKKRRRAEEQQVEAINSAIGAWTVGIVPSIEEAIVRANAIVRDAHIQLTSQIAASRPVREGRLGPPIPSVPALIVAAAIEAGSLTGDAAADAQLQVKETLENLARWPRLYFEINTDGKVAIRPENYAAKTRVAVPPDIFHAKMAEEAIVEFVEAIAPRPTH